MACLSRAQTEAAVWSFPRAAGSPSAAVARYGAMPDEDLMGDFITRQAKPSPWAVALFLAACAFTGGALLLLVLSWT